VGPDTTRGSIDLTGAPVAESEPLCQRHPDDVRERLGAVAAALPASSKAVRAALIDEVAAIRARVDALEVRRPSASPSSETSGSSAVESSVSLDEMRQRLAAVDRISWLTRYEDAEDLVMKAISSIWARVRYGDFPTFADRVHQISRIGLEGPEHVLGPFQQWSAADLEGYTQVQYCKNRSFCHQLGRGSAYAALGLEAETFTVKEIAKLRKMQGAKETKRYIACMFLGSRDAPALKVDFVYKLIQSLPGSVPPPSPRGRQDTRSPQPGHRHGSSRSPHAKQFSGRGSGLSF
jgi:hypothetical protein